MTYYHFVNDVMNQGHWVDSRYGEMLESIGASLILPLHRIPVRPGLSYGIGWQEGLQLIAGDFDLEAIKRCAPGARHELFTAAMAYGPRIRTNVENVIGAITELQSRRQAVLFIGDRIDGPTERLPCTLTMQFIETKGFLNTVVSMRSWDLIKGAPYDIMQFNMLTLAIARVLGLHAGHLVVHTGSAHIYLADREKVPIEHEERLISFDESVPKTWREMVEWARQYDILQKGATPKGVLFR